MNIEEQKSTDKKTIDSMINEKLLLQRLAIQLPHTNDKYCKIMKADENGIGIFFENFFPPNDKFLISGMSEDRFIEIEIKIIEPIQNSFFLCKANYLRISKQRRIEPRYKITDHTEIFMKNIKISRSNLKLNKDHIPLAYEIILEKYEKDKSSLGNSVIIKPFKEKSKIHDYVARTGKTIFIEDAHKPQVEISDDDNDEIADLKIVLGDDYKPFINTLIKKNIHGLIICPIFGNMSTDYWMPIGYIEVRCIESIDMIKLMEVKTLSFEILNTLLDMSVDTFQEKQEILDVSRTGLSMKITDKKLLDMILHKDKFIFDIIIKHQAPITFKGLICSKHEISEHEYIFGIKIVGSSERHNQMYRYLEYVAILAKY